MGLSRETSPLHFSFDEIFRPRSKFVPGDDWSDIKKESWKDCEITRCQPPHWLDSAFVYFFYIFPIPYSSTPFLSLASRFDVERIFAKLRQVKFYLGEDGFKDTSRL